MSSLNNGNHKFSLKTRLLLVIVGTSVFTLLIATASFIYYDICSYKETLKNNITLLADLTGDHSGSALVSFEADSVTKTLDSLKQHEQIIEAVVYLASGETLASFQRDLQHDPQHEHDRPLQKPTSLNAAAIFEHNELSIIRDINFENKKVGTIYLRADLTELNEQIVAMIMVSLIILLITCACAVLIALRLQSMISQPILELIALTQKVKDTSDFSVRVSSDRDDELGTLIENFNAMLNEIEQRGRALEISAREIQDSHDEIKAHRDGLQKLVEERTAELAISLEAAKSSTKSKSDFLAMMSHEIRTPMNAIIGMSEILLEASLPFEEREYVETIGTSAHSLLTIINDILDFSKLEAGKLTVENVHFGLRSVVSQVIDIEFYSAQVKGIPLELRIDPSLPDDVTGDPIRIRQVLLNLVANAIKFTKKGFIFINVDCVSQMGEHVDIRFSVKDTGIGIEQDKIGRIFEDFTQADTSTTRLYGGTGLGLSISRKLAELMGGKLVATSQFGSGSTFALELRMQLYKNPLETQEEEENIFAGKRAYIFDANDLKRTILIELLESWRVTCEAVDSIDELGERIKPANNNLPDFVFVNAEDSNIELEFFIQAFQKTETSTQLILLLSRLDERGRGLYESLGIMGLAYTPIQEKQLRRIMYACLGKTESNQSAQLLTRLGKAQEGSEPAALKGHILLVDDNVVNQKVAMVMIRKLGYSVDVKPDGFSAVDAFKKNHYDLILMDCQMPLMDGFEATTKIRALEPEGERIPIVALTANVQSSDRHKCLSCGMDDFLAKPVKKESMELMLESYIHGDVSGVIAMTKNLHSTSNNSTSVSGNPGPNK